MTRQEFIKSISDRFTSDCGIPVNIKPGTIDTYINDSLKVFRQSYDDVIQTEYLIISKELTNTKLFQAKRQIRLPDCVEAIYELSDSTGYLGGGRVPIEISPDYRKFNYPLVGYGGTSYAGRTDMVYSVVNAYYQDFISSNFTLTGISFDYSRITKLLTVLGRDTYNDMIAEVGVSISDESIFESVYFKKYVLAELYELADMILNFVEFNTIGGNRINTSRLVSIGERYRQEVQDEFDRSNSAVDYFDLI